MGAVAPIIGAIAGLAGSAASALQQAKAGKQAKKIAAQNAAMEAAQTREEEKRMRAEQARQQSLARARASASGVGGQSTNIYMDALAKAGEEEIDWLKKVGASKYDKALTEGRIAKNEAQTGMWGSILDAGKTVLGFF